MTRKVESKTKRSAVGGKRGPVPEEASVRHHPHNGVAKKTPPSGVDSKERKRDSAKGRLVTVVPKTEKARDSAKGRSGKPTPKRVEKTRKAVGDGSVPENDSGKAQKNCKDKNKVFRRKHSVTPIQLETIQGRFPDWTFEFGGGAPHDHPLGATERAIAESIVIDEIKRLYGSVKITDIGGNATRHAAEKRTNVHSCNPILSSDDVVRRSRNKDGGNWCNNRAQECGVSADVYISIHSLYYMTPKEVLVCLLKSSKKRLYAVVHRFDELYGSMHHNGEFAESKYETYINEHGDARVRMQVHGNCTSYEHDNLSWLNTSSFTYRQHTMCWSGRKIGDSWSYEFVLAPPGSFDLKTDSTGTMSLTASLSRRDHVGSVEGVLSPGDEGSFKPMLNVLKLQKARIKSFGPFLWISRGHETRILIPKGVVETVAFKMVGVPRDKAGLRLCINTMKNIVKPERMSMPDKMRLDCVVYGSALAFVHTLADEIATFNELCSPYYKRMFKGLSEAISFESPFWTWWGLFASATACCAGGDRDYNATVETYNSTRASAPGPSFDARLAWPNGLPGYESRRPLVDIREGAYLRADNRVHKGNVNDISREDKPEKGEFFPICTTFSNYIPVVPTASNNNEVVSLANRALMKVPVAEQTLWANVLEYGDKLMARLTPVIPDVEADFAAWNAKFPEAKRRLHVKAWNSLRDVPLQQIDFCRKQFVKRELTMKGGPEPEEFDPRSIQGNTDRLNVSLGPFTARAAEKLKEIWNKDSRIYYTSGATAEEIGEWRKQFGDQDVTIIACDESRYDAHQGENAHRLTQIFMDRVGIEDYPGADYALSSMERITGWSGTGVKYAVDYTMTSGAPTTSTSNSLANGVKTSFALERCDYHDFKMVIHGDDSLVVIPGKLSPTKLAELRKEFLSIQKRLGYTTKFTATHSWSDTEYCSSLFWPVDGGYVLGPKVGKRLPKIGFSLRRLKTSEVKGMLIGLSIEAGYIPVLRTYATHQLKLLKTVKAAPHQDVRRVYKSLPTTRHKLTAETEYFFLERYGVSPSEADVALQSCLTRNLTDCVDYSLLTVFTQRDL